MMIHSRCSSAHCFKESFSLSNLLMVVRASGKPQNQVGVRGPKFAAKRSDQGQRSVVVTVACVRVVQVAVD